MAPAEPALPRPLTRPAARTHLTPRELERLTGIAEERLRSWARRFGYPTVVGGRRRYLASEIPGLIATKQLVASGLPVGGAIDEARRRHAEPVDLRALTETFDALDVAVVGLQIADPAVAPLARVYANRAADPGFPCLGDETTRELVHMAGHAGEPRIVWLESSPGEDDQQHEAMAFTLGAPTFSPALVVVMELPSAGRSVRRRDELLRRQQAERATANGMALARRQLQIHGGTAGLRPAFEAIRCGVGADDGFIALRYGASLQRSISLRGHLLPSRVPSSVTRELDAAARIEAPMWLDPSSVQALGGEGACLAVPLRVGGRDLGYACLEFDASIELTPGTQELLMGFGVMQASVIAREHR